MEEQFILRAPPSVADRIDCFLSEDETSQEESLDLTFSENGRSGMFVIGNEQFSASLLDLPCAVESFKTYDDCALVKTADIGEMIMVRELDDSAPDVVEYRHGLSHPMRDARKRRFRREPDLNPELVQLVEKDLLNIMTGEKLKMQNPEVNEQEEDGDGNARDANKKDVPSPAPKQPDIAEAGANTVVPERSDSDESDDSM